MNQVGPGRNAAAHVIQLVRIQACIEVTTGFLDTRINSTLKLVKSGTVDKSGMNTLIRSFTKRQFVFHWDLIPVTFPTLWFWLEKQYKLIEPTR